MGSYSGTYHGFDGMRRFFFFFSEGTLYYFVDDRRFTIAELHGTHLIAMRMASFILLP